MRAKKKQFSACERNEATEQMPSRKKSWTDLVSFRLILVEHSSVEAMHREEKTISSARASGAELG